ncbi:MAG: hypothetical protein ACI8QZ_003322 [Chlamydiales bacterium]|jgi:hypothetical protein
MFGESLKRPLRVRRQRFWIALTGVLMMLLSLSAEGVHELFRPHRLCAVHGALEHGHGAEISGHSERIQGDDDRESGPIVSDNDGSGDHEACGLVTLTRERMLHWLRGSSWSDAAAPTSRSDELQSQLARAPSIEIYRLAPKQSPPAA